MRPVEVDSFVPSRCIKVVLHLKQMQLHCYLKANQVMSAFL